MTALKLRLSFTEKVVIKTEENMWAKAVQDKSESTNRSAVAEMVVANSSSIRGGKISI